MINLDNPAFTIALLAALGGLRLAAYVSQRHSRKAEEHPLTPLEPDEVCEPAEATSSDEVETESTVDVVPDTTQNSSAPEKRVKEHEQPFFLEVLDAFIIAVVLVFCLIRPFLLQAFVIPTGSMIPTLREGDQLMTTKYTYHLREPRHGDVIVFRAPEIALSMNPTSGSPTVDYVKRVIGIPGDRIRIVAGVGVYRNGEVIKEPYIRDVPNYDFPLTNNGGMLNIDSEVLPQLERHIENKELVVPPGYLFVLGDNRNGSFDSHSWGLLDRKRLIGKAAFIFWPFSRWGTIH